MNDKFVRWTSALTLALALFLTVWTVLGWGGQPEDPVARSYNTDVYTEQGGGKLVVASGGELEVQSGGTLDIQSGATTDFSGGVDLDGASLVVDADGDSAMAEASDDLVTFTLGAATGSFEVRTGNLQVGNGTPGQTHDGEDLYVEGIIEVDGAATFDGNADVAGTLEYGADGLFPVGYATSGQQLVYGTASITTTAVVAHGLTTVTFCQATMGEDPTAGAGDAAHVTVTVAANDCTLLAWQDDFVTAATETDVAVHWLVIGLP